MSLANLANLSRITFEPGDLLLFAGRGPDSRAIAAETCSWWQLAIGQWFSHVGIVARYQSRLLLFESTTLCDEPCEISRRKLDGVQAHDPRRRVAHYNGRAWRLRLRNPLIVSGGQAASERLSDFLTDAIGAPYSYYGAAVAGTHWLKFARWLHPDNSHYFCSQLVMTGLRIARVVDQDLNPAIYSPAGMARDLVYWGTYQPIGAKGSQSVRLKSCC